MAMTIHIDIVSAEGAIHSGTAEMVYAPALMGEVGIAPRHAQLITTLLPGEVRVDEGPEKGMQSYFISGGMLEVQPHMVTILADTAVRAEDLDEAAALQAKQRAEQAMKDKSSQFEYAQAQAELVEAAARLRTIEKMRKFKNKS